MAQWRSAPGGRALVLALSVALAGAACLVGATDVRAESLVAAGDPPDLFMLFTGDVIGYVDPCG